jgi:HEAT repeat protein
MLITRRSLLKGLAGAAGFAAGSAASPKAEMIFGAASAFARRRRGGAGIVELIKLLGSGDPAERENAMAKLIRQGKAAAPKLMDALMGQGNETRREAAKALKEIGLSRAQLDSLLSRFSKGDREALDALGILQDVRALPALMRAASKDSSDLGRMACSAIASYSYFEVAGALGDKDKDIRMSAALTLGLCSQRPVIRFPNGTRIMAGACTANSLSSVPASLFYTAFPELQGLSANPREDADVRKAADYALACIRRSNGLKVYLIQ